MTLYLWHIPTIVATILLLHVAGIDVVSPAQPGFWVLMIVRAAVFAVVMAMAFVLLLPLEHRRLRWWDDRIAAGGGRATAIGVLVCAAGLAILLMAKQSLGTETGWWALLGFLVALSSTLTYFRVPYDTESAGAKIRAAGLPQRLASRLEHGE